MMKVFFTFVAFLFFTLSAQAEKEISLYNKQGSAAAYIAINENLTIYLWDGKPVAYLSQNNSNEYHVYGFNGKHLGWFKEGFLYDNQGGAAGFIKNASNKPTELEGIKGIKEIRPIEGIKEIAPIKPIFSNYFSNIPLEILLSGGSN